MYSLWLIVEGLGFRVYTDYTDYTDYMDYKLRVECLGFRV